MFGFSAYCNICDYIASTRIGRVVGAATCSYMAYRAFKCAWELEEGEYLRARIRDKIINVLATKPEDGLRRDFQSRLGTVKYRSPPGHSHGGAAQERTAAALSMVEFVEAQGYRPYVVSTSGRDARYDGVHGYHMAKDVQHPARCDPILPYHMIMMVDVDYYVSVKAFLKKGNPVIMYTFVPDRVAGQIRDGAFTIEGDRVKYRVNGGGRYDHELWEYGTDWLRVDYLTGSWVCSVEQKEVGDQHRIIFINPVRWIWSPLARLLNGDVLRRRRFETNGVNRLDRIDATGRIRVSLGMPGEYVSVEEDMEMFNAASIRVASSKTPDIHSVETYLRLMEDKDDKDGQARACMKAPLLYKLLMRQPAAMTTLSIAGGKPASYQCHGPVTEGFSPSDDGKELGRQVAPPLAKNPAVVPQLSRNNDTQCIKGRITEVRNTVEPPRKYYQYAAEFAETLVGGADGKGCPWSVDQVDQVQNRPTQKARTEQVRQFITENTDPVRIRAFMKKEAYSGINDPRNISQVPATHTLKLSAYTYAFKEQVLKQQPWYMPGKKPSEIAKRLFDLAKMNSALSETDYSRFDGTISSFLRGVERKVYLRWAAMDNKSYLGNLLTAEYNAKGATAKGVRYGAGFGRLSGSPLTTDGNTIINAYVSYCANREGGMSPREAYDALGAYGGDDGASPSEKRLMEMVAKDLGLSLKCEKRSHEPVNFLGRVFINPWVSEASIQDPVRTIKKLHISFAPPDVTDAQALLNRAIGYGQLDPEAPIVGVWCETAKRVVGGGELDPQVAEKCRMDLPYFTGWPQATRDQSLPVVADRLELTIANVESIEADIRTAKTVAQLPSGLVPTPDQDKYQVAVRYGSALPLPRRTPKKSRPPARSDSGRSSGGSSQ